LTTEDPAEGGEVRQVAFITGGSRGIGKAIAVRLAKDGFAVAVNARGAADVEAVVGEVRDHGGRALAVAGDVTDRDFVFNAIGRTVDEFGHLEVMVANAGIVRVRSFLDLTKEDLGEVMDLNLYGAIYCMQAAAQVMIAQGHGGKIVLANSVSGHLGVEYLTSYTASKFGLIGVAQCAAKELARFGITVNSYCPGIVPTDMWDRLDRDLGAVLGNAAGDTIKERGGAIALGRLESPEDVAGLVSYLVSSDANYMTGQSIVIDGGLIFR
jgi:meso-butanediol dehydrogenase/(S,S)-butanediol dehydrogenase/diacetyl reductase